MGIKQSKLAVQSSIPIPATNVEVSPTLIDDESDITRPAPRRQLRTLSMLIDPIQLATSDNNDVCKETPPDLVIGPEFGVPISPEDYLKPATMFDFERPLSIRERQERVRARIAALQAAPQQRFRDCRRRRRFLNAMRRVLGCGVGNVD